MIGLDTNLGSFIALGPIDAHLDDTIRGKQSRGFIHPDERKHRVMG
jgi:hypothetical protein